MPLGKRVSFKLAVWLSWFSNTKTRDFIECEEDRVCLGSRYNIANHVLLSGFPFIGTEAKRRRRAAFTLVKQITTADIQDESIEITGLAKYTNYTVQVIGYTKFLGAQSEIYTVLTEEDG